MRVNLKTEKVCQKRKKFLSLKVELKTFLMTELGNYLENKLKIGNLQKKEKINFRWELNSKPFIMAEVVNYLENKSNGY